MTAVSARRFRQSRLANASPELECLLTQANLPPPKFAVSDIQYVSVFVAMRDGTRLATDLYLPPVRPAPVIVVRTPYGRDAENHGYTASFLSFARRGYAVVAQDCRGTGDSEPDSWDYYMFESEDGYDCIEWITGQEWCGSFIGSFGGSYVGQTQWCMATHPAMSTIVPAMSGLGIGFITAHLYMFLNAYSRSVGKGEQKVAIPYDKMERLMIDETLAGGYFNDPLHVPFSEELLRQFPGLRELSHTQGQRWLWQQYCAMTSAQRAEFVKSALGVKRVTFESMESISALFGQRISQDAHTIPNASTPDLCRSIQAPPLLRTGWYDWFLTDVFATWNMFRREAQLNIAARARLIITPYAHNKPGYREGVDAHPELLHLPNHFDSVGLLLSWYEAVREGTTEVWPTVIYYLMGANEWRVASDWPVPEAKEMGFYFGSSGTLTTEPPQKPGQPDRYIYDPKKPTPTMGGSILSYVYTPGSVDVSSAQSRPDVVAYTTQILERDVDVVGPLRMILYASSTAVDTDFVGRLSDVFPDGRAIQIQSGILRARYRNLDGEPQLLEPGRVYRFEVDMWATANRFKAGHRLRVDVSSADFPHYDRNSNRGGDPGDAVAAQQTIYHDPEHPSCVLMSVLTEESSSAYAP